MNIKVNIINNESNETINVENVKDYKHFEYVDNDLAKCTVDINEHGITINRKSNTHSTLLYLKDNENSFVEIISDEGNIKISTKVLAFENNHDIITLVYKIDDSEYKIIIEIRE